MASNQDIFQQFISKIEHNNLWNDHRTVDRAEYLKIGGTTDTNLYFIEEGSFRVFVIDEDEEQTIRFGYKNELILALDSYLNNKPSDLFIQAIKHSKIKVLSKSRFEQMLEEDSTLKINWVSILESLVLQQMERERDLLTTSPLERYKRVLKRSPHLFQLIPHKYIASYLRMTPETLSRLKKS